MGVIGKIFAVVMFPLSILIILESLGIYSLSLPFDKILIGAILMIVLQILTLVFLRLHTGKLNPMQIITAIVFIGLSAAALYSYFFTMAFKEQIPLILGAVMFVETIYALH
jgi:hypothetical protein